MLGLIRRRALVAAATATTIVGVGARRLPLTSPSPLPPHLTVPLSHFSFLVDADRRVKREAKGKKKERKAMKRGKSRDNREDPADEGGGGRAASDAGELGLSVVPAPDRYDPVLDVGPNGDPLFTERRSISLLKREDVNTYIDFSLQDLNEKLPEGFPMGMTKEIEETRRCALLVRKNFLELRDNYRRIVDPPMHTSPKSPKIRRQIVLDGPVSCGKSIALAMLVHWARSEGWLVFYVPEAKEWTHGGSFYRNPDTNLFDTPFQASKILQDFLKYNSTSLQKLPCQISDPILLGGEDAGSAAKGGLMALPEGATLFDLIQSGVGYKEASVGAVVRLRKELSLVKDIPVLFAIDQYNSWFTFSEFKEQVTVHSQRQVHAKYLSTVNAYRSMMHEDMMVGAFSHSTAVGKLRQELPDVPLDARIQLPRYSLEEAAAVCHYYLRQKLIRRESFSESKWKRIFYVSNGNGSEMRWLVPFI